MLEVSIGVQCLYSPAIKNTADSAPALQVRPPPHLIHINTFLKGDLKFSNTITLALLKLCLHPTK